MKDPCFSVSGLLEKYFDGETTEKERSSVEGHLAGCPACQETLKRMETFKDLLKVPMEEAVLQEDYQQVWNRIHRKIRLREGPAWWESMRLWLDFSHLLQKRVLIPAAAAIAVLIFLSASLLFQKAPLYPHLSVVEYVESQDYNVMVYESEKPRVTVIWLFEEPEQGASSS